MIRIIKVNQKEHLIICKKSKYKHLKNFLFSLSDSGEKLQYIILDSTRELHVLPLLFFLKFFRIKVSILLVSISSSIKSISSLRKPLNHRKTRLIKFLFSNSLIYHNNSTYSFYSPKVTFVLSLLRMTNFNPYFDGVNPNVTNVFSMYPILNPHHKALKENDVFFKYVKNPTLSVSEKNGILFAIPQFYEQGFMKLSDSKKIISEMIYFIRKSNPGIKLDISLHPRMDKNNYNDLFETCYQNDFTEIIHKYESFYAINSSTVFLADQANCKCIIFRCDFLDYDYFENKLNEENVNFIDWNVKKSILLNSRS